MPVQQLLKAKNPFYVCSSQLCECNNSKTGTILHNLIPLHSSTSDEWVFQLSFAIFFVPVLIPMVLLFRFKVEKLRHTFLQLFPFGRSATTFSAKRRGNSTLAPCRMQQYYSDPGPPTPPVSNIIWIHSQYGIYISNIIWVYSQYSICISNIIEYIVLNFNTVFISICAHIGKHWHSIIDDCISVETF